MASGRAAARRIVKRTALAAASLRSATGLRVLCYHSIAPEQLDAHVARLKRRASLISEDELVASVQGRREIPTDRLEVAITFDDGYAATVADDMLRVSERHGLQPILFSVACVVTGEIASRLEVDEHGRPRPLADADGLRRARDAGWAIGSHTTNHFDCGTATADDAAREVSGAARLLRDALGTEVRTFAWPWGRRENVSDVAREVVAQEHEVAFAAVGAAVTTTDDPFFVPRNPIDGWWSPREVLGCVAGALDGVRKV